MKKPRYIFIHHTAVSYDKNPDQWKATDKYHKSKGWGGGGYNYEIAKNGSIHQFREDGAVTAAQYQQNMNDGRAISICLDGNFNVEEPTLEQKEAAQKLIKEKMEKYEIPKENVFCHRKVATYKSCPGKLLPDDIYDYFFSLLHMPSPIQQTQQISNHQSIKKPIPILPWAKDACFWALKTGLIRDPSNLDEHKQWTLVVLQKMWDKLQPEEHK